MLHPSYSDLMKVVNSEVEQGEAPVVTRGYCWGPSASEGPQKQNLTVFLEYNV